MKRSELFFTFLLLPIDIIMIVAAFSLAYFFRSKGEIIPVTYIWPFRQYLQFVLIQLPFWVIIFALEGLYSPKHSRRGLDEFSGIFLGVSSGIVVAVIWLFLSRSMFFSRLVIVFAWVLGIILVFIGRRLVKGWQRYLYKYGIGVHRVVIIGDNGVVDDLTAEIIGNRKLGYRLIGLIQTRSNRSKTDKSNLKILGEIQNFADIAARLAIDDIIMADPHLSESKILKVLDVCQDKNINFHLIPNLLEVHSANIDFGSLAGIPMMEYRRTPLEGWGKILKRIGDIILASLGLVVGSPLILLIAIAIKIDSRGPVFFCQKRLGADGEFIFYKFRSMRQGAEKLHSQYIKKYGNMFKLKDDPRATRFGKFLRRTSLDELPQLWNVWRGDMSIVGPRPPMPIEVKHYSSKQRKRMGIKPGLTGLWQASGRSELSFNEWVKLDVWYIENWSLWLDLEIIIRTIITVLRRKGAY